MSGGRQVLVWLVIGLLAACSTPATVGTSLPAYKMVPPDLSVTVVPVALSRPEPVLYQIALRELRAEVWDVPQFQHDEDQIRLAMAERVPQAVVPTSRRRAPLPLPPDYVEALIQTYFLEADWEWARRVSWCESRWDANAKNPNSTASGLFQHLASYWDQRSQWAGWGGADIFDPEANTAVAAWLYYDGGPGHWVCK